MEKKERKLALSIDAVAFVIGTGLEAVRKAIRNGKIKTCYRLEFGDSGMTLLPFEEVESYWLSDTENLSRWHRERVLVVMRDSFVVDTPEVELEVLAGKVTKVTWKEIQEEAKRMNFIK